ncbi:MAG: hypothetical protein HY680_01890, partial [Chloroflexi bacterium]|nr:hypothetical protein [Chloroflexota bacterium]
SVKRLEGEAKGETEVAVQGTLKSIDVAKSQITVTLADGKDITLDVSSRSKVNVEGSISPLPGLKRVIGSQVSVEYSPEMKVVGALNARAGPGGTIDVTGIIKAVNPAQGKVTIQTPDGREVEIDVTAASTIVADGTISSLVALAGKVGEELSVKLDARTNAPLSLKAQASGDAHAAGTLKAVDASAGTIIIATGASGDTTLTVDASTQVEIGGDSATLADLASKIGTQIVAEYSSNTSIATEVKVAGRSGMVSKSMGTIRSVDQAAGTVTMAAEGSADLTVMVSSDTRIQIGPAEGTLANLAAQVGARAFVEYAAGTLAASRITVQGAGSPRAAVSGTLKAVNEGASVITVAPQTGSEVVLKVSANTKILVGGKASALAALVALVGSRVAVQYDAQTSTALAVEASGGAFPTNAHLEATLKAVDQTNGTVTITSGAGVDIALKVDGLTRLTLDGAATTLAALSGQVGARAVADYVVQAQTATLIAVSTAGDDRAATGSGSATGPSGGRGSGEANSGNGSGAGGGTSSGSTANRASISIAGTLKGVNVVSGTVDIADQYGILLTLKVSTQSKISVKGTTGSLAQLATMLGAEVRAEYDASTMTVVSLSV